MIRRLLPLALSLVAVATLASCGTFTNNHEAASMFGNALDRSDLEQYTGDLYPTQDGIVAADQPRTVLALWVKDQITRQYLDEQGVTIDDATTQEATAQVDQFVQGQPGEFSEATKSFLVDVIAARLALQAILPEGAPSPFDLSVPVVIDPRYGRWDPSAPFLDSAPFDVGAVVPLG